MKWIIADVTSKASTHFIHWKKLLMILFYLLSFTCLDKWNHFQVVLSSCMFQLFKNIWTEYLGKIVFVWPGTLMGNPVDVFCRKKNLYDNCFCACVMISTFTLSTFHSFQVTYNLALYMVFTSRRLSDRQDAAHIIVTLDIIMNSQWTDCFLKAIKSTDWEILFKNFESVRDVLKDSFPF